MSVVTLSDQIGDRGLASIKTLAGRRNIKFGMAVEPAYLSGHAATSLIAEECSIIVAENAMKPGNMEPTEGNFTFTNADAIAAYATVNNISLRGHILAAWHSNLAAWHAAAIAADWEEVMTRRVETVGPRYNVTAWDVHNEVTEPNGSGWRTSSVWYQAAGELFFARGYELARVHCPVGTRLAYCDHSVEHNNADSITKRALILTLLEDLVAEDLVDDFNAQAHVSTWSDIRFDQASWRTFIQDVQSLGLRFNITEFDFYNETQTTNETYDYAVAELTKRLIGTWLEECNGGEELLVWGPKDDLSWRLTDNGKPQRPLPWDSNGKPKQFERALRSVFA